MKLRSRQFVKIIISLESRKKNTKQFTKYRSLGTAVIGNVKLSI